MKRICLLFLVIMGCYGAKSQTLTVVNNSGCPLYITARGSDSTSLDSVLHPDGTRTYTNCNTIYGSPWYGLAPGGGTVIITAADASPATNNLAWTHLDFWNVDYLNCWSGSGSGGCAYGIDYVSICAGKYVSCIIPVICSSCAATNLTATWVPQGQDAIVYIQ